MTVGPTWRYRLLKTGRMPEALKREANVPDVVASAEGISLVGRSSRRCPRVPVPCRCPSSSRR